MVRPPWSVLRGPSSVIRSPSLRGPSSVVRLRLSVFLHFSILLLMLRPSNALATASELLLFSHKHDFFHFFTPHLFSSTPSPQSNKCNKVTQLCERGTFRHRSYILLICFRLFCQHIQKLIFRGWGKADVAGFVKQGLHKNSKFALHVSWFFWK